jgi:hypothetical protein
MNYFNIQNSLKLLKRPLDKKDPINIYILRKEDDPCRKFEKIFWAIDIHGTIMPPDYQKINKSDNFNYYTNAKEVLQMLSRRKDIFGLILYTCSYKEEIDIYLEKFSNDGITFDWVNENGECPSTKIGDFDKKFYFNILLDDKAGFDGNEDWGIIKNIFQPLFK